MLRALIVALTLLVPPSAALLASTADGYRLAGIIAVGEDYLAVLELPGGEQVLVRQGSEIVGGGRIQLLDADRMRIALPDHVLDLALDRSLNAPVVPAGLGVVQEQTDEGNVLIRRVDPDAFRASVAQSRAAAGAAPGTPTKGKKTDAQAEAGRRLTPILNLPPDSRIVAVNEQPVRSADQAAALIEKSLAAGISPRLNITGAGGESRVYMSPATR